LASGIAALSLVGASVLGFTGVASAQQQSRCAANSNAGNVYPPGGLGAGQGQGQGPGISDSTPNRGQQVTATSGCRAFAPGQRVNFGVESTYQQLGTVTATQFGEAIATFAVPNNLENGRHDVVFTGPSPAGPETTVRVPFTIVAGAVVVVGAAPVRSGLPFTGSHELVVLGVAGGALVALGAGIVVVARRRPEELPAGLA
ncbi:MAG: hypothetical protein ACR2K2_10345, partial [Mycobacteriales bacterium]